MSLSILALNTIFWPVKVAYLIISTVSPTASDRETVGMGGGVRDLKPISEAPTDPQASLLSEDGQSSINLASNLRRSPSDPDACRTHTLVLSLSQSLVAQIGWCVNPYLAQGFRNHNHLLILATAMLKAIDQYDRCKANALEHLLHLIDQWNQLVARYKTAQAALQSKDQRLAEYQERQEAADLEIAILRKELESQRVDTAPKPAPSLSDTPGACNVFVQQGEGNVGEATREVGFAHDPAPVKVEAVIANAYMADAAAANAFHLSGSAASSAVASINADDDAAPPSVTSSDEDATCSAASGDNCGGSDQVQCEEFDILQRAIQEGDVDKMLNRYSSAKLKAAVEESVLAGEKVGWSEDQERDALHHKGVLAHEHTQAAQELRLGEALASYGFITDTELTARVTNEMKARSDLDLAQEHLQICSDYATACKLTAADASIKVLTIAAFEAGKKAAAGSVSRRGSGGSSDSGINSPGQFEAGGVAYQSLTPSPSFNYLAAMPTTEAVATASVVTPRHRRSYENSVLAPDGTPAATGIATGSISPTASSTSGTLSPLQPPESFSTDGSSSGTAPLSPGSTPGVRPSTPISGNPAYCKTGALWVPPQPPPSYEDVLAGELAVKCALAALSEDPMDLVREQARLGFHESRTGKEHRMEPRTPRDWR